MTEIDTKRIMQSMRKDTPEPAPEEAAAVAAVLAALSDLRPEGRVRVLRTAEAFYGKPRGTRGIVE